MKMQKGIDILNVAVSKANCMGIDKTDLSKMMGMSPAYLSALLNGARPLDGVSFDKLRRLAKFLDISMVQLLRDCGALTEEDFRSSEEELNKFLFNTLKQMRSDLLFMELAPTEKEQEALSIAELVRIASLYTKATMTSLQNTTKSIK
jgi:transcriptional regulator with XRE-family HTH domain